MYLCAGAIQTVLLNYIYIHMVNEIHIYQYFNGNSEEIYMIKKNHTESLIPVYEFFCQFVKEKEFLDNLYHHCYTLVSVILKNTSTTFYVEL